MAADTGDINFMNSYAIRITNSIEVPINIEEGKKYFKMTANAGLTIAMFNYALLLSKDKSNESNLKEAAKYYKMACNIKINYIYCDFPKKIPVFAL